MTKDNIFYAVCFGFGTGVLWRSFFHVDSRAALLIGFISLILILFFSLPLRKKQGILVSVFALSLSLGILRFHAADAPPPEFFKHQIGQKISLSGTVADKPVKKENGSEIPLETEQGGSEIGILIFAKKNEGYRYGDRITLTGKLEAPADFLTDQGTKFDYVNYLKKDGIFFVIRSPKIELVSRGGGNFLKRALFAASDRLAETLNRVMPEPESAMMRSLILGERASLNQSLRQEFVTTGTIHIVTISGYHVALVAEWIMKIFGFLPAFFAIVAGIAGVFLYVVMTGGAQTAIRAGIMAALALLARAGGRAYDAGRALVAAGVVMIIVNPFILAFDVSFQLSFLAVIAVIFFVPNVERYFLWIPWKWLRDIVSVTGSIYVFVLPFILYKIGNLSLVALPTNVAVLPLIPATMIAGFLTGFVGLVSDVLALVPGKVAFVLLFCELAAIGFFSRLPFASLPVPDFPFVLVVLIYGIFFCYLFARVPWPRFILDGAGKVKINPRTLVLVAAFLLTMSSAGFLSHRHYQSGQEAGRRLQTLLAGASGAQPSDVFDPDPRSKSGACEVRGPLPDRGCTPGAVFADATAEQICVRGYTRSVRNVSQKLRKEVFAEYDISYPQPRGAYEVDHLIPLALGGSNDIANLFPEAAEPTPGFHEKDLVEVYLQEEVCARRVVLPAAQRQIADDWLGVYHNLTPEQIAALKKKYGGR